MNSRDQLNDPCAGQMHRITAAGAVPPYRWRCVICERQFLTAPNSIRVDAPAAAAPGVLPDPAPAPGSPDEPGEPLFVAIKSAVMAGKDHVATAVSKTMAKRIAAALNKARKERE